MTLSAAIMKEVLDQKIKMKSIELATTDMDMKEVEDVDEMLQEIRRARAERKRSASDCTTKSTGSDYVNASKTDDQFRNYNDSATQERVLNFYKSQHQHQTFSWVIEQENKYSNHNKLKLTVWEVFTLMDTFIDDSDPDTEQSQTIHALQSAEAARKQYPGGSYDWLHLTCFIHDLGKLLGAPVEGFNLPGFAVVGDTFPVGCKFSDTNVFQHTFKTNPDSHNEKYTSKLGVYEEGCGLKNVHMSWGHDEYLYRVCLHNKSTLPPQALYCIRFHSFYPWHKEGGYSHLTDEEDRKMLKWVKIFNQFDLYSKADDIPDIEKVKMYYQSLIKKYFPHSDKLEW